MERQGTEPSLRASHHHPDSLESHVWAHRAYIGHEAWLHLFFTQVVPQHMGQRWGCLHVLETGEPVLRVHGEELQGGPLSDKAPQKNGHLSQVEATLKVSTGRGLEPQDPKWLVRKGGIKGYGPRDSLIPVPHIQGQQWSFRDVVPRFASRWQ